MGAQAAELEAAELQPEAIAWHRPVVAPGAHPSAEVALQEGRSAGPGAWAERAWARRPEELVARDVPEGPLQEAEVWVAGAAQSVAPHAAEELQQEAAA